MTKPSEKVGTRAIGVKTVPTNSLLPNPHNPRMLFDKKPLDVLKGSIAKVGILVPLTVYRNDKQQAFVILDGQRRWICAQELDLKAVPVNQVAEPTTVQNIVTMFQIHKLRADWELMPTALKVEVLIKELKEKSSSRLAELTNLDEAVVVRCKKLLSYAKKFQDMMLDPDPAKRIPADFFIELYVIVHDREVSKMDWFKKDHFILRMLDRYLKRNGIKSVTDFRIMKQLISHARNASIVKELSRRLHEFVEDDSLPLLHLAIHAASVYASAKKILGNVTKLESQIADLDVERFYGEEELWKRLEKLIEVIRSKLTAANRRLK